MQCGIVISHARTARVGLPLTLVHALESMPVAAGVAIVEISWFRQPTNEVRSTTSVVIARTAAWSGEALQGPPCVSLARDVLECWGLNVSQMVSVRLIPAPVPIARAVLEPVSPRDWEVINASASFLESALVAQAGVLQLGCTLPLWGVAAALAHVAVVDIQPSDAVLLCDATEIHIIPKPQPSLLSSTELHVTGDGAPPAPSVLRMTVDASLETLWLGLHPDYFSRCQLVALRPDFSGTSPPSSSPCIVLLTRPHTGTHPNHCSLHPSLANALGLLPGSYVSMSFPPASRQLLECVCLRAATTRRIGSISPADASLHHTSDGVFPSSAASSSLSDRNGMGGIPDAVVNRATGRLMAAFTQWFNCMASALQQLHPASPSLCNTCLQSLPSTFLIPIPPISGGLTTINPIARAFVHVSPPDPSNSSSSPSETPASFSLDFSSAVPRMLANEPPVVIQLLRDDFWPPIPPPLWLNCYDEPFQNALACLRARLAAQRYISATLDTAPPTRSFVIVNPQDVLSRTCCRCCCLITSPASGGKTSAAVAIGTKLMQSRNDWLQQAVVCEYISLRAITRRDDGSDDGQVGSGFDDPSSAGKGIGSKARDFEAQLYACVHRGPVIIIIDDIDAAVNDAGAGGGGSNSLTLHGLALLRFCRFLTFSAPYAAVVVIATCSAAGVVAASSLGSIGLFDAPMQLSEPTAREMVAIASASWVERGIEVAADVDAECFKGYTLSEIDTIIERACTSALLKSHWPESGALSLAAVPRITAAIISSSMSGWVSAGVKSAGVVQSNSSLDDVGGMQRVKMAIFDMLSFQTRHSELFASAPVRVQTGMLLYGYPGCGKTMIVGAACRSVGLPLIVVQGPEILNKYIGASESEIRRVFDRARAVAPCVLFFDEFDAISRRRGHDNTGVTDRVVNQLLTSLDGFEVLKNVFVIAATSRPDIIDPALLRPGRLDTHLLCNLPDEEERADVLRVACKGIELAADVDLLRVAAACAGMTYADVNALVYSAQLNAAAASAMNQEQHVNAGSSHARPQEITARDFEAALSTTPLSLPQQHC